MKLYDYSNIEKLFTVGDIHGEFSTFFRVIKNNLKYNKDEYKEDVHPLIKAEQEEIERQNARFRDVLYNFGDDDGMPRPISPKRNYNRNGLYNNSVIIVAGDCGFGFSKLEYYNDILTKANELFFNTNTHIIFVRGNHDDPKYFNEELINFSNIKTVQDYSVIKTMFLTTLCIGGAVSVDRLWRKQQEIRLNRYSKSKRHRLYWEGEECFLNENIIQELDDNNIKIDSVVTHTCPSFCLPIEKDSAIAWLKLDETLKKDLDNERNLMTELFNILTKKYDIKFWSYGHFHQQYEYLEKKVVFLALDDNIVIKNPLSVREHILIMEEEKKNKNNKKKKKIINDNDVSISELYNRLRHNIIENQAIEGDAINDLLFNNEENNVMVDEEPF